VEGEEMVIQARKIEMCRNRNTTTEEEKLIVKKRVSSKKEPMEKSAHKTEMKQYNCQNIEQKKKCTLKTRAIRSRKNPNKSLSIENDVRTMK